MHPQKTFGMGQSEAVTRGHGSTAKERGCHSRKRARPGVCNQGNFPDKVDEHWWISRWMNTGETKKLSKNTRCSFQTLPFCRSCENKTTT